VKNVKSIHKYLLQKLKDEKLWPLPTVVHFGYKMESENRKESCHCMFLPNEYEVLLFAVRALSLPYICKQPTILFKCNKKYMRLVLNICEISRVLFENEI